MKVILILGAAVWANGPSPALSRRCAHALKLWKADKTQTLIPCGGTGDIPPAEAVMMKQIFVENGVPPAMIICEDQSTTTFENIHNAKALIADQAIQQVTIVSDIYHLPRAAMVARYFGFRVRVSGPSLRAAHRPTQIKNIARECGALPLYALKLATHWISQRLTN